MNNLINSQEYKGVYKNSEEYRGMQNIQEHCKYLKYSLKYVGIWNMMPIIIPNIIDDFSSDLPLVALVSYDAGRLYSQWLAYKLAYLFHQLSSAVSPGLI